ncbi:MAG: hypothetical protein HYY00_07165 [Chloroflexi bacterium]|nr:hypothetical protein [Chloroflexota bacterium]
MFPRVCALLWAGCSRVDAMEGEPGRDGGGSVDSRDDILRLTISQTNGFCSDVVDSREEVA